MKQEQTHKLKRQKCNRITRIDNEKKMEKSKINKQIRASDVADEQTTKYTMTCWKFLTSARSARSALSAFTLNEEAMQRNVHMNWNSSLNILCIVPFCCLLGFFFHFILVLKKRTTHTEHSKQISCDFCIFRNRFVVHFYRCLFSNRFHAIWLLHK